MSHVSKIIKHSWIIVLLGLLVLQGCAKTETHPTNKDLMKGLHTHVAERNGGVGAKQSFVVRDIQVLVSENVGTDTFPRIEGRYQATLETIKPLYKKVSNYEKDFVILRQTDPRGFKNEITGTFRSEADRITDEGIVWKHGFSIDGEIERRWKGRPIEWFNKYRIPQIEGTKEYEAWQAAIVEEKQREEERKIKAAEERKTAIARKKQQAKIAAEKAAKEKRAKDAAFSKSLAGTWTTVGYLLDRSGNVYKNYGAPDECGAIKFTFTVPESSSPVMTTELTVYSDKNITGALSKSVEAQLTADGHANKIILTFPKFDIRCKWTRDGSSRERSTSVFTATGKSYSGIVNNNEVKLVGGRNRSIIMRKS